MTIYNQISANKARTGILISLFVVFFSFVFYLIGRYLGNPEGYLLIGFLISVISSFASYFYSDKIVLFTARAKPADKKKYFDLYTVCENIAIASGLPMPRIYVIDDLSPNAFATGRNVKHAVVVATTGLLEKLDRTELEGVVAHEFSHVKNYDILLSTVISVLVGTLVLVTDMIMRGFWFGGLTDDEERPNPAFLILFIAVLIITPIVATLIQLAISRKREYLADASGALLTRYPEGLASALEKISKDSRPLKSASGANAHLFIENPFKNTNTKKWFTSLFDTHPPVEDRIKILRSM